MQNLQKKRRVRAAMISALMAGALFVPSQPAAAQAQPEHHCFFTHSAGGHSSAVRCITNEPPQQFRISVSCSFGEREYGPWRQMGATQASTTASSAHCPNGIQVTGVQTR